jgi:hypothetical protein
MGPEPENLLEIDRIEDVLEQDGAPQPVVVVQNRNRVLPSLLIVGSIVLVALGSAFAYREVVRSRKQTELARRDLHRAIEQAQAEENERRLKALPTPADPPEVFATDAGPSDSTGAPPVLVSAGAGTPTRPQASGPSQSPELPATDASPSGEPEAPTPSAEGRRPAASSPALRPKVLSHLVGKADPALNPGSGPPVPAGPTPGPGPAASGQPAASSAPITASGNAAGRSPFDDLNEGGEPGRAAAPADVATAPASASMVADPKAGAETPAASTPPDTAPTEPPLPSREETERQIRAEAAAIKQHNDQQLEQQQEDLHVLRDDERRQFLDELRMILKVQGRMAGPEIERLSNRAGRTDDPRLLMRARMVIGENRTPQRVKVRKLREFGVPEAVILDYLCHGLDKNLGARNGPRTRNEVWIHAGELLLKYYDLDARRTADPPATPVGHPAAGGAPRPR